PAWARRPGPPHRRPPSRARSRSCCARAPSRPTKRSGSSGRCSSIESSRSRGGKGMAGAQATLDQLRTAGLADVDPEIASLLGRELERQRAQIELIASENFTWPSVLEAVGSGPPKKNAE